MTFDFDRALDASEDLDQDLPAQRAPGRKTLTAALRPNPRPARASRSAAGHPSGSRELDLEAPPISFDALLARGTAIPAPAELIEALGEAHDRDLEPVRLWHVPALAEFGMSGLTRGLDIAVADPGDRETIEHELGHVVDGDGEGVAEANAFIEGLHFAHDPAREDRADQLGAAKPTRKAPARADQAPGPKPATPSNAAPSEAAPPRRRPAPDAALAPAASAPIAPVAAIAPRKAPVRAAAGAPRARLTRRADFHKSGTQYQWTQHKTKVDPVLTAGLGGPTLTGFRAEGRGALTSTPGVVPSMAFGPPVADQLSSVDAVVTPRLISARPPLRPPHHHPHGHMGAYILPAELLGQSVPGNALYLPFAVVGALRAWQQDVVGHAQRVPGRFRADSTMGADGLVTALTITFTHLDGQTGAPTGPSLVFQPVIPIDRATWGAPGGPLAAGAPLPAGAGERKTVIDWAAGGPHGDGLRVSAMLGPDHPLGSAPSNAPAKASVDRLHNAAGKKTGYIAGHLLNDHLGGPGDLQANLAPIPKDANAQMAASIEGPAKRIVNDQLGWIQYDVAVTYSADAASANLAYPSQIDASMQVVQPDGTLGAATQSRIAIEAPSVIRAAGGATSVTTGALTGAAGLTSSRGFDEVVLTVADELRPFLKNSDELYQTLVNGALNPSVDAAALATAWARILAARSAFADAVATPFNLIKTVTDATRIWEDDPVAETFLNATRVGDVQHALDAGHAAATGFATAINALLQDAQVAVRDDIRVSDIMVDTATLEFAQALIRGFPPGRSMLEALQAQHAATLPLHTNALAAATSSGDAAALALEDDFAVSANKRHRVVPSGTPASPIHTFEAYGSTAAEVTETAQYGIGFESVRMNAATNFMCDALSGAGGDGMIAALAANPILAGNERLGAVIRQMRRARADIVSGETDPHAIPDLRLLIGETLQALAREQPAVAQVLMTALGL